LKISIYVYVIIVIKLILMALKKAIKLLLQSILKKE
jgi:hypothetical protein